MMRAPRAEVNTAVACRATEHRRRRAAFMLACSSAAEAASAPTVPPASRPVQTAMLTDGADRPAATPTAPSAEPEALCARVRKRFWIEGEGWIVRRVSACR